MTTENPAPTYAEVVDALRKLLAFTDPTMFQSSCQFCGGSYKLVDDHIEERHDDDCPRYEATHLVARLALTRLDASRTEASE